MKRFLLLKSENLVYARVPKAANSSVRAALASIIDTNPRDGLRPSNDRFWTKCTFGKTQMLSERLYTKNYGKYLSFSFIREPEDRLFSCYVDKIVDCEALTAGFEARDYHADMSFDDFVRLTCSMSVEEMNVHTQPQTYLISDAVGRLPHFVGRVEHLSRDWEVLRWLCKKRGVQLPKNVGKKNSKKEARRGVSGRLTDQARKMMHATYFRDIQLHERLAAI